MPANSLRRRRDRASLVPSSLPLKRTPRRLYALLLYLLGLYLDAVAAYNIAGGSSRRAFLGAAAATAAVLKTGQKPPPPVGYELSNERLFDTRSRSYLPVAPGRLIRQGSDVARERIVIVGEAHSHPLHHRLQFNLIKALDSLRAENSDLTGNRKPEPLSIGLEMLYRQQQGALDRFVFLHGNLGLLRLETNWDTTWGYPLDCYAKIFQYARAHGIRLVGLNAPLPLLSLVRRVGLEALPGELSALLPEMDLGNLRHRQRFESSLAAMDGVHGVLDAERRARLYQAFVLWDETLADTAATYLKKEGGKLVILAGNSHVEGRNGIPDRLERRTGIRPFVVVPQGVAWSPQTGLPEVEQPPDSSYADWVVFTEKELA